MSKYLAIIRIHARAAFTYRGNVIGRLISLGLIIYVLFRVWLSIYQDGGPDGYSLTQIVWYLCITELIAYGCRPFGMQSISAEVKSGAIALQLLRPWHYLGAQLASALGGMLFSAVSLGLMIIALGLLTVGPLLQFTLAALWTGVLAAALGWLINFFLLLGLGLTAFHIEDSSGPLLIYSKIVFMLGMLIPIEFLPDWLQQIALWLPFSYVAWAPARLFVAFRPAEALRIIPIQLLWLGLSFLFCLAMFRSGSRRIEMNGG